MINQYRQSFPRKPYGKIDCFKRTGAGPKNTRGILSRIYVTILLQPNRGEIWGHSMLCYTTFVLLLQ